MRLSRLLSLATVATSISLSSATNFFQVVGNKIYNTNNESVIFKGIGFTCTEYMQRTIFGPDFWWESCFVGPPPPHYNTTMVLTNETQFVLNYLLPDTLGGNFPTSLPIQKVTFDAPFNEVIDMSSPKHHPIVRIPVTASSYLYDEDANHLGSAGYRQAIDMLVQFYTSNGVAVIIDHHSSCEGTLPCPRGGPMAIRNMGNYSGSLAFWDLVAYTYGNNPLVLYELYNEPHVWYQAYYGGDPLYAGMAEMLDVIRKHTQGLVIVGAASQYSQDANSGLAFYLQYVREHNNTPPSNVIYNLHPYQGVYQGLEHSLRATMRLTLALKTIGPVIFTEFGQYCCNGNGFQTCQKGGGDNCKDHAHADNFVYNIANLAAQYDISFTGWGWRGRNGPSGNCTQGMTQCGTPDMRDNSPLDGRTGVLTNGTLGGANWKLVWETFINPPNKIIQVQDALPNIHLNGTAYEPQGYLPRPCIVGQFIGNYCGYPLGTNLSVIGKDWNSLWNQTVYESVLPGLPPSSAPDQCVLQTCPGYEPCNTTNPIIPMANPCGK